MTTRTEVGGQISPDFLPPQMRKHVDPAAPVPLRMMAAKGLVPLSPVHMLGALYMLSTDPDPGVRETAEKSAAGLPERILSAALRDEAVQPPVLGWFLGKLWDKDAYAELLVLNANTPDEAVAAIASGCSAKVAELISENQLRLLRHPDIVRQLVQNPALPGSVIDRTCDFAVRSGVMLEDVPQMQAARVRIFGPEEAAKPHDPGPTAEDVLRDFGPADGPETGEEPGLNLTQRLMRMSIAEKIKLATLGNKEARTILLRDSNKLVATAAIRSPRITDGEILAQANNRAAHEDVLRTVYSNKEWTKDYQVKLALVKNPKVPVAIVMRFLSTLRESDVKDLSRNRNVSSGVQTLAKRMMEKKTAPKRGKG